MAFEEWIKAAVGRIDDIVAEDMDDNLGDPDYEEDDMLMAAANAIWEETDGVKVGSELEKMLNEELAKAWIHYAYSQWYTGDVKEEDELKRLLELVARG